MVEEELAGLLSAGERAVFRGVPGQGVVPLERAQLMAAESGDAARGARAAWLLGICRTAIGQYGTALEGLVATAADSSLDPGLRSLPASAVAAIQRQIGRHEEGRDWDNGALESAAGNVEAECDAHLGLAADAVGLGDPESAQSSIKQVEALVGDAAPWWRQRIRADWARAELFLLVGEPSQARAAAERALDAAESATAPRHVAKSLLFAGVAATAHGQSSAAVDLLSRAAVLAEGLGSRPLIWPSRAMLGALLAGTDPTDSARNLDVARAVVRDISRDLPPHLSEEWLARRDIRALLD